MKNISSFHSTVIIYCFYFPLLHIILSEEFLDKGILLNFCLFRPPLRTHLMNGDFFVGSAIGSTLTKLALRFIELEKDQVKQNVNIHLILPFTIVNCFSQFLEVQIRKRSVLQSHYNAIVSIAIRVSRSAIWNRL